MINNKKKWDLVEEYELGFHMIAHFYKETKRAVRRISGIEHPVYDSFEFGVSSGPILTEVGNDLEADINLLKSKFIESQFNTTKDAIDYLEGWLYGLEYRNFFMTYMTNIEMINSYAKRVLENTLNHPSGELVLSSYDVVKFLKEN